MDTTELAGKDTYELEQILEDYVVGKVTYPMVEILAMQLWFAINKPQRASIFGQAAFDALTSLDQSSFSAWVVQNIGL